MIRSIRKKHKIVWLILAILLPILFIASIWFRHPEAVNETVPLTDKTQNSMKK